MIKEIQGMEFWKKSIRLDGWDYRKPWYYFVTMCTKDRRHYFGEIRDGVMSLTEQGCAAWYFWNEIPNHFDNVKLDEFVVMPDHVHGIIQIIPNKNGAPRVGIQHAESLHEGREFGKPMAGSLSTIIRSYKSALTRWCNQRNYEFAWQPRFYDHIVRNYRALDNIRLYIKLNPAKWESHHDDADHQFDH